MPPEFDVAVVGAGIVGASCAWECARAGLTVALIEPGLTGGGATAANMGQLVVEDGSEPEFRLTQYSLRLWRDLQSELPPEAEFDRVGSIWIASDEAEMRALERKQESYVRRGVPATLLDSEALAVLEPNLRAGLAGGLLTPDDVVIYPPPACDFLVGGARALGARVFRGHAAESIERSTVRLTDGSRVSARTIVNAAGTASPTLSPGVPVRPRKGQLAITDRYPGWIHHQLVEMGYVERAASGSPESVSFNLQPRRTGQLLIGSSRQLGNDDPRVDPGFLRSMLDRALEFVPGLSRLSVVRTWAGFRPASSDHLPLIGPWPLQDGVYLATGHDGLGVTMALGTGRLLADQVVGRTPEIPVEPYLPARVLGGSHGG
ncbi:MAG: FAD-dependent oxidoreductase [Thermoplasmata archaeon]